MTYELPPGLDLAGRRVLVLGLGITGREISKVLLARGAYVFASDAGEVDVSVEGVDVETGSHDRARRDLDSFDFVFASPGISPLRGFLADVVASGKPVVSELELGAAITAAPVVAVTGTNGKTTVCRLGERIGRAAGREVYACGNLETKFLTAAHEHPAADAFVVEASSFSLASCRTFRPRVAVVTSLAPDHLDWHGTFEHYRESKSRIASAQRRGDLFVYPAAQPDLREFAPADGPLATPFSATPIDGGAWTHGDEIVLDFDAVSLRAPGVSALASRGSHFAANAAAAAAAMAFLGVGAEGISGGLANFEFDPHRLDLVGHRGGVAFVDDSAATNADAALAAIRSFEQPVVLIAGGRNKNIDLGPLANASDRLRAVVAIGEAATDIERIFDPTGVFVSIARSMREAVHVAIEKAQSGDVVLLSPACASHDMYRSYVERGHDFVGACRDAGVG